jgi:hypothetical protein
MKLIDLVSRDGKLSHTKIWANVAYLAATIGFIRATWTGTATYDIWLAYLGVVGGAVTASKFLSLKYRGPELTAEEKP